MREQLAAVLEAGAGTAAAAGIVAVVAVGIAAGAAGIAVVAGTVAEAAAGTAAAGTEAFEVLVAELVAVVASSHHSYTSEN